MAQPLTPKLARGVLSSFASRHLGAIGVLMAGLLVSEINVLSARNYSRVDASKGRSYSLTEPTDRLLARLDRPVQITTLLASETPYRVELKYLLAAYRAASSKIDLKNVNPDRQPAEYLAIVRDIAALSEEGSSGSREPAVLVKSREKEWLIYADQLSRLNHEGVPESLVEQRLSEAILQVTQLERDRICFVVGHGEASIDDPSPDGLSELRNALGRANIDAQRVPLDVPVPANAIADCPAIAIVGPTRPLPVAHEQALLERVKNGAQLIAFLDPLVSQEGRIQPVGLDTLTRTFGVIVEPGFVLEGDPALRGPGGLGESFFATPKTHEITQGLSTDQARLDARVWVVAAQPLRAFPGGGAQALMSTSGQGQALVDLKSTQETTTERGSIQLAFADQIQKGDGSNLRGVIVGTSSLARNAALSDEAQFGNRIFVENAFAWLLKREGLISIPQRPTMSAGLNLSEESLAQLLRYVLFYLPLSAAGLGAWVLWRRSSKETRSRRPSEDPS